LQPAGAMDSAQRVIPTCRIDAAKGWRLNGTGIRQLAPQNTSPMRLDLVTQAVNNEDRNIRANFRQRAGFSLFVLSNAFPA